jgi:hypothetical protein
MGGVCTCGYLRYVLLSFFVCLRMDISYAIFSAETPKTRMGQVQRPEILLRMAIVCIRKLRFESLGDVSQENKGNVLASKINKICFNSSSYNTA